MEQKANIFKNRTILLGVTGGVAAYKSAEVASRFTKAGAAVFTIMTENATKLVGPKTFEAVTGNAVYTTMWQLRSEPIISHLSLTSRADAIVVAPATANIIAKMAAGISDDLLSTALCAAWKKQILLAPAMNTDMWLNPVVQRNIKSLTDMGIKTVGPAEGRLACGTSGPGRMEEPAEIVERLAVLMAEA
jgi:phosphopantothenoylcysteine synthetase/decarboxylase